MAQVRDAEQQTAFPRSGGTVTRPTNSTKSLPVSDLYGAVPAIESTENSRVRGNLDSVTMAAAKDSHLLNLETPPTSLLASVENVIGIGVDSILAQDNGGDGTGEPGGGEYVKGVDSLPSVVSARGRGGIDAKAWQQEGDWPCPNSSCSNINFSFRGICNRCGTARPAGSFSAIGGGLGCSRIRGRGPGDSGCRSGRGAGGPPGLFAPNDWNCPMCGNVNWAKRTKCNICNTAKPGYNEGGAREGRAGGYKEFDEAEIEETKRRRREMKEDDGEIYDEFGNLKKKFRAKARAGDSLVATSLGKAGWSMEELGVADRSKEKSRDRSCFTCVIDSDNDQGGTDYCQNLSIAQRCQRGNETVRDIQRDVDKSNSERDRGDFNVKDQDRVSGRAWAWERVAVSGRKIKDCLLQSENEQHVEWLRPRKGVRERDRIMD